MPRSEQAEPMPAILSPSGLPLPAPRPRPSIALASPPTEAPPGTDDRSKESPPAEAVYQAPGLGTRALSLTALIAAAAATFGLARGLYYATVDSWIVPTTLTPESDTVVQLNIQLNEQLTEHARLVAEGQRIAGDIGSVSAATRRLEALRSNSDGALLWSAREASNRATAMTSSIASLKQQKEMLRSMLVRSESLATRAAKDVADGLAPQVERERELQAIAQVRLALTETERQVNASRHDRDEMKRTADALSSHGTIDDGKLPEVVDRDERDVRLILELEKLDAEKRSLEASLKANGEALTEKDETIAQLPRRPQARALEGSMDLAFVPYTQLKGIAVGAALVRCRAIVLGCRTVGTVAEILPGEVTTTDPWADSARGQYVVLDLSDREAAREKTLRVRLPFVRPSFAGR